MMIIPDNDELKERYNGQSIQELKLIKPSWAFSYNSSKLYRKYLRKSALEYKILVVNVERLADYAVFDEVDLKTLFTGTEPNDHRVARILYRWENGLFIDPPEIYLTEGKQVLKFHDGRHRTKVAYHLGFEKIPVAIFLTDFKRIKKMLKL